MKYLLDTHTLLWALENNDYLSDEVRGILLDDNNLIYVSTVSLLEISIKHKKHPEIMQYTTKEIVDYSTRAGYIFLSFSVDNTIMHERIDYGTHNDPFDQMLIAQSVSNNMLLISHDETIRKINPQLTVYF